MERTPVQSDALASVGYDPETHTLEIEFNNGAVYQYKNVPQDVFEGLRSSDSLGTFYNTQIRSKYDEQFII